MLAKAPTAQPEGGARLRPRFGLGAKATASEWAGQNTAEGAEFSQDEAGKLIRLKKADSVAGQTPLMNDVATVAQLSAINGGTATYNRPGYTFAGGGGFDFGFVLDFGSQQASFGMQNITSPILMMPPGNGITLTAIATDFASGSNGKAIFQIPASFVFGPICSPCNVLVDTAVLNTGGIAHEIAAKVSVQGSGVEAMADLGHIPGFYTP